MPGGDYEISLLEFLALLEAINNDVSQQGTMTDYDYRSWYDTPFYDMGGAVSSNVCVQLIGCFARQELNYIAQGAASARVMEGSAAMTLLIVGWKRDQYDQWPSIKTLAAAKIGHMSYTVSHPLNLVVSMTPFRNPIPFVSTVISYCQGTATYC
jgi:hypothetical protein